MKRRFIAGLTGLGVLLGAASIAPFTPIASGCCQRQQENYSPREEQTIQATTQPTQPSTLIETIAATQPVSQPTTTSAATCPTTRSAGITSSESARYIPQQMREGYSLGSLSNKEIKIEENPVTINDGSFVVYKNEFAEKDELDFMLREKDDVITHYSFGKIPSAVNVPTEFYIPTKVVNEDGQKANGIILQERGTSFTLETFILGTGAEATEFFIPKAKEHSFIKLPFYFIEVAQNEVNVTTTPEGEIKILAPKGMFRPQVVSYEGYVNRKKEFEAKEKQRAEKDAKEKVPKTGTVKEVEFNISPRRK